MYAINEKLEQLEKQGSPVMASLIGAGQMGTDIIAQAQLMKGFHLAVIVDLSIDNIKKSCEQAEYKVPMAFTDDMDEAAKAVAEGKTVGTTSWKVAATLPPVQVVIDATGSPQMGAVITLECIEQKKHIVMMNVECDITVGPILKKKADEAGVIYSMGAGDEPAAVMELYRFADALGFTVVCAGKGKNNPLDITATPDSLAEKAKSRNMSANMLCEFVDGSKTAIEMASVSNATGLIPDIRGMHGAKSTVDTLNKVFVPKKDGGCLENIGTVDFAIGVHPGVYLTVTTDSARLRDSLIQRDMGTGPYYTLFRPFHLCSIEIPLTAAQTVIYGESSGHPMKKLTSECIAVAKKDMKPGEVLDGIGGFCYRVIIEKAEISAAEGCLPAGLAKGCIVKKNIAKGDVITRDMVEINDDSVIWQLRHEQDKMFQ